MPNTDNLRLLVGKNKRNKKNLQSHIQPINNHFCGNIMQNINRPPLLPTPGIPSRPNLVCTSGTRFQAPHQQEIVDLVDDNSPNNPITGAISGPALLSNKPGGLQKPWFTPKPNNIQEASGEASSVEKKSGNPNQNTNLDININTQKEGEGSASCIQLFTVTGTSKGTITLQKPSTASDNVQETHSTNSGNPGHTSNIYSGIKPVDINLLVAKPQQNMQSVSRRKPYYNNEICQNMNYPKGIPRSFLVNQRRQQREQYTASQPVVPTIRIQGATPNWIQAPQIDIFPTPDFSKDAPIFATNIAPAYNTPNFVTNTPMFVQTDNQISVPTQAYSPSDVYADGSIAVENNDEELREGSESPELCQTGNKRLSAFKRLGPLSQPKKPKLTINLLCNKDQSVREVVDDAEDNQDKEKYTPVHLRQDVLSSNDDTVKKYLSRWPWKKTVPCKRIVTNRNSKSVMILEQEQMEEAYEKKIIFIQVSVKGYPPSWNKEDVLDAVLDSVKGKSFIPCFTEFTQDECKFLVIRSRSALLYIHKYGFCIRKDSVELVLTISQTDLNLNHIDFIPRLVLRKRLSLGYDAERKLNLKGFTLASDLSHFIYFPLRRVCNQLELMKLEGTVAWDYLTDLDLSHNRITSITGFDLQSTTPRLKHLDLSYNCLERLTILLSCKELPLRSIKLEGNPLCHDYTDPRHYVKVIKMIFPSVMDIDGVPVQLKGDIPKFTKNFCPEGAKHVVEKVLEVFFPLLDAPGEQRALIGYMYDKDAIMTVTYMYKLRYSPLYKNFRNLFLRARVIDEGETESIEGATAIAKLINRWPDLKHDPFTFTVDVMFHDDATTVLRVGGVLKLTAETLAEDEHLLAFTRTLVLFTEDGAEYRIRNDMLYWDQPTEEYGNTAFQVTTVKTKNLNLKLDSPPDEDLKEKLLEIFMKVTEMDKKPSERCLETKNWNIKAAIEHFSRLLKLDELECLTMEPV